MPRQWFYTFETQWDKKNSFIKTMDDLWEKPHQERISNLALLSNNKF